MARVVVVTTAPMDAASTPRGASKMCLKRRRSIAAPNAQRRAVCVAHASRRACVNNLSDVVGSFFVCVASPSKKEEYPYLCLRIPHLLKLLKCCWRQLIAPIMNWVLMFAYFRQGYSIFIVPFPSKEGKSTISITRTNQLSFE